MAPQTPQRPERPGEAVALFDAPANGLSGWQRIVCLVGRAPNLAVEVAQVLHKQVARAVLTDLEVVAAGATLTTGRGCRRLSYPSDHTHWSLDEIHRLAASGDRQMTKGQIACRRAR